MIIGCGRVGSQIAANMDRAGHEVVIVDRDPNAFSRAAIRGVLTRDFRGDLAAMIGYLKTWSATQRYEAVVGRDPLESIEGELSDAWGPAEEVRPFRWDLDLRIGRNG